MVEDNMVKPVSITDFFLPQLHSAALVYTEQADCVRQWLESRACSQSGVSRPVSLGPLGSRHCSGGGNWPQLRAVMGWGPPLTHWAKHALPGGTCPLSTHEPLPVVFQVPVWNLPTLVSAERKTAASSVLQPSGTLTPLWETGQADGSR